MQQAFVPSSATVNIDVSSSTGSIALGPSHPGQVRVMNNGTATVWCQFGGSTVTATTAAGWPVGPSVTEVLSVPTGFTHVAAIAAGSTGKIYFTPGGGI